MKGDSLVLAEAMARILELEAELEGVDEALNFSFLPGQTRQSIIASIREAAVDHANQKARAEKAEARVANLENQITRWRRRYPNDVSEEAYQLLLAARPNASDAIAREREAE